MIHKNEENKFAQTEYDTVIYKYVLYYFKTEKKVFFEEFSNDPCFSSVAHCLIPWCLETTSGHQGSKKVPTAIW